MKKLLPVIIASLFTAPVLAGNGSSSTVANDATYNSTTAQSPNMVNNQFNSTQLGQYSVGDVTCNEAGLTVGAAINNTSASAYNHRNRASSTTLMVGFQASTDKLSSWVTGKPTRCEKAVDADLRIRKIIEKTKQTELEFAIADKCAYFKSLGIAPDAAVFEWAEKCQGLKIVSMPVQFSK